MGRDRRDMTIMKAARLALLAFGIGCVYSA